ncbi:hypothetical protein [Pararhizobium haloflavum]|uniref:hypothetical protein n=1 Tax=Pararhizobium haloflavum TaxID=2037914 RepID=UPI000C182CD5|nr:hypothetical protein [Pararhizobium haloflavum]
MRIPDIRNRLIEKAAQHNDRELAVLAEHLRRRKPEKRAPNSSQPMTPELKVLIQAYSLAHSKASYEEIARKFNVNIGRVSEALRGIRS